MSSTISNRGSTPTGTEHRWHHTNRGGTRYWRVIGQGWADPADTTYSKAYGGRWNPAGAFGVLYLNAGLDVARANARRYLVSHGLEVSDLAAGTGPELIVFAVEPSEVVDVVTDDGVAACGLPPEYPYNVDQQQCRTLGIHLYAAGETGVACRCAAECPGPGQYIGEELPLFDYQDGTLPGAGARLSFDTWYHAKV